MREILTNLREKYIREMLIRVFVSNFTGGKVYASLWHGSIIIKATFQK